MSKWRLALSGLFVEHSRRLEALAYRRTKDREVSAELAQEAFLRLFSAGSTGSPTRDAERLYIMLKNATTDHIRTHLRRKRLLSSLVPEQLIQGQPPLEREIESRESINRLGYAVEQLEDLTKEVFILRQIHGKSNVETAEALQISTRAVEKHLAVGLKHCRKCLQNSE